MLNKLIIKQFSLEFKYECQRVVKLFEVKCSILYSRVVAGDLMMVRGEHVNHVIISVKAVDFVARSVFYELTRPIIQLENASKQSVVREESLSSFEPPQGYVVKRAHRTIAYECLNYFGELLNEVRCADTTY